ncbi:hypothetical protein HG535_0D06140 [Zygotorulaspora mrakii]|uniref:SelT/selW/selH selenoprotein domain-containing protein n=1 Tax=Zygotorulaspora mrakii TaxID=42260 RepID=A0A7H9B2L7_ZYGMR|nr:uncharacterized protein HG535_0D06140 [Zygotorulaspora mrakii]QLG72905.1 hypothetical protein HG535_0D06140 [Zygotorulaspora mrakii]
MPYPKINIIFCIKCKWNLRSAWYLQELLQTFGEQIGEISMIPGPSGEFKITGQLTANSEPICIWDRKIHNGFPESKLLKQKVRKLLFEDKVTIGSHNERASSDKPTSSALQQSRTLISDEPCRECNDI